MGLVSFSRHSFPHLVLSTFDLCFLTANQFLYIDQYYFTACFSAVFQTVQTHTIVSTLYFHTYSDCGHHTALKCQASLPVRRAR